MKRQKQSEKRHSREQVWLALQRCIAEGKKIERVPGSGRKLSTNIKRAVRRAEGKRSRQEAQQQVNAYLNGKTVEVAV